MYIDPGTGSMLFTILVGLLSTGAYKFKDSIVKAKFYLNGGKTVSKDREGADFVIFSDHKRYWNVFEPICDEFEKRQCEILYMTASPDDPALEKNYSYVKAEFIGEGNKAFAKLNTLNTRIVLSTTPGLDVLYWKRSPKTDYYVHIPHASSDLTLYRMFGLDFYDAVLTPGDYHEQQIRQLEHLRGIPEKEIVKVGMTYMDSMKERLKSTRQKNSYEDRTVLLAPSWGDSAILSRYGGAIIEALLKTDYHIIIRPHPQSYTSEKVLLDELMKKYPESNQLEWNNDNDNFEVLRRSDIMISDFSGVMFDFSLVFDKPVIYTDVDFDPSPYDACWLDETPWTFRVLPDLGLKLTQDNLDDVGELIDRCLNEKHFAEGREKARCETWAYIGESAERVVDYLLNKRDELAKASEKQEGNNNR